jgi:predicted metal-dependent hydrolase
LLPDYTIRESPRAKHVRFRVTPSEGLVVVVPIGFDRRRIPALLEGKRAWLTRALKQMEDRRAAMPSPDCPPETIELRALDQFWQLDWVETGTTTIEIRETDAFFLRVSGPIQDRAKWQPALRQWLIERARETLTPWMKDLSRELGIPIHRVMIRCQKTRWGSYSTKGTVSLNAQLLFLPRPLVRYILIHELCHAVNANHSAKFWDLVHQWEPKSGELRRDIRRAAHAVPSWLQHERSSSSDHRRDCD